MTDILIRRGKDTSRREGHMTVEAEIGVMCLSAKECPKFQGAPRSYKKAKKDSSLGPSEGE